MYVNMSNYRIAARRKNVRVREKESEGEGE